jgi:hypothetical protein
MYFVFNTMINKDIEFPYKLCAFVIYIFFVYFSFETPFFDIESLNWDTFSRWEVHPDRRVGYLGDVDWDHNWEPVVSSDDEDSDEDEDDEAGDEDYEDEVRTTPRRHRLLVSAARSPARYTMAG